MKFKKKHKIGEENIRVDTEANSNMSVHIKVKIIWDWEKNEPDKKNWESRIKKRFHYKAIANRVFIFFSNQVDFEIILTFYLQNIFIVITSKPHRLQAEWSKHTLLHYDSLISDNL